VRARQTEAAAAAAVTSRDAPAILGQKERNWGRRSGSILVSYFGGQSSDNSPTGKLGPGVHARAPSGRDSCIYIATSSNAF